MDAHGNIFIADYENNVVREVNASTGMITTVAGNGTLGSTGDGGPATTRRAVPPHSVAVDSEGNLFIAADDDVIRELNASTGVITTVVGNGMQGYSGDGGPATAAEPNDPSRIAFDSHGDLFIADMYNDVVREVAGLSPPTSTQGPPPNQTPPPTPPPIAKLERVGLMNVRTGKNKTTEVIELHFSKALNSGNPQNTSDFSLVTIPKKKNKRRTGGAGRYKVQRGEFHGDPDAPQAARVESADAAHRCRRQSAGRGGPSARRRRQHCSGP